MEVWAVVILGSVIASVTGMTLLARRPWQRRSPDPLFIDLSREESYSKFYEYISKMKLDFLMWTITERETGRYVIAELKYSEEFENKSIRCDTLVHFDFSSLGKERTKLRWYCEYKHWCDKDTARRMEGHIASWLQVLFEKPIAVVDDAKASSVADESESMTPERKLDLKLECQFQSRRPINLTFERLHARLLNSTDTSQSWKISVLDATSPDLISCDFEVLDDLGSLSAKAKLDFNLEVDIGKKTLVKWTYIPTYALAFDEHKKTIERVDDWIRLVLTA